MKERVVSVEKVPEVDRASVVRADGSELLLRVFEEGGWTLVLEGDGITTLQASGVLDRFSYSPLPDHIERDHEDG